VRMFLGVMPGRQRIKPQTEVGGLSRRAFGRRDLDARMSHAPQPAAATRALPSPAIPEFGYNRPVPCGYAGIDLSLVGVGWNRPVPWASGLATDVPSKSELRRHREQVAAQRHAAILVDPGARLRPFFQARAGGSTARAKSRREKAAILPRAYDRSSGRPNSRPGLFIVPLSTTSLQVQVRRSEAR
jgi:hypothetical protein